MKAIRIILFAAGFAFYLASCNFDKAEQPQKVNTDNCIDSGHVVTYVADIKSILETHCTDPKYGDCHQAGSLNGFDYTNYDNIAAEAANGNLYERVLNPNTPQTKMPSPLSAESNVMATCD